MCRNLFPAHRRQQCAEGGRRHRQFLRSQTGRRSDFDLNEPAVALDAANLAIADRYRRLLALYRTVVHQNAIRSWKEFGSKR